MKAHIFYSPIISQRIKYLFVAKWMSWSLIWAVIASICIVHGHKIHFINLVPDTCIHIWHTWLVALLDGNHEAGCVPTSKFHHHRHRYGFAPVDTYEFKPINVRDVSPLCFYLLASALLPRTSNTWQWITINIAMQTSSKHRKGVLFYAIFK